MNIMLSKVFWNSLLVTPAVLSAALMASSAMAADLQVTDLKASDASTAELAVAPAPTSPSADAAIASSDVSNAQTSVQQLTASEPIALSNSASVQAPVSASVEALTQLAQAVPTAPATQSTSDSENSLQQVIEYSNEGTTTQDQVTSISQLSDVQPTDWAFQALQSLVERYGCIAGYPDGTFRGSRAMTRYEFAAGMNACLDRVNELIAAGLADAVTREDLATLQRLQEEFAAELATLRGRVDALEARTSELEANQFSTTTRLVGRTIFALQDAFGGEGYLRGGTNTVFESRVRLNFDTSFTGNDRLRARLQWGNFNQFGSDANPIGSYPSPDSSLFFNAQQSLSFGTNTNGNVKLGRLEYYFPVGSATTVYLEGYGASLSDIVSSASSFDDPEQGSISYFGYNPIYDLIQGDGIGAGATVNVARNIQLGGGYLTGNGASPADGNGLFNGTYTAFGQLTYGLNSGPLVLALTYANNYLAPLITNAYGVSGQFQITKQLFVGGWATYYDSDAVNGTGDSKFWTYAGTLGVSDLGIRGSLLGFIVGVPPRSTEFSIGGVRSRYPDPTGTGGRSFRGTQDASLHVEGFYRVPLTDNISVTPGVIWVSDPGNNNNNSSFVIGTIRTTFSF
jgi:hypothetical protein